MRFPLVGALLGASLVIGAWAGRSSSEPAMVPAMDAPAHTRSGELYTHVAGADGQPLTITVVDSRQRVMAVYHVDRNSGEISLTSVRNITWDLQLIEYNSGKPLPQDIRNGLKH